MFMLSQHFAKLWQEKTIARSMKKNSSNFIVPLKRLDQLHQNNNLLTQYNKYYKETSFCLPNINLLSIRKLRCVLCLKWQNKNKLRFVVSINFFWVFFIPFLYNGEYYRPSTLPYPLPPPTCQIHNFPPHG